MIFTESFVMVLVFGALLGTSIAAIALIAMFIHDVKHKQVW